MTNTNPFGEPIRFIDVGHSRIPYFRVGSGPDLLFVHGWPLHSATFRHVVPRLSDAFTCHLIDLPGTGESVWDAHSKISLRDHAASLRQVVTALDLRDYAILAHDSGAVIARLMAADDASIRGLVIGNSEIPGYHPWQIQAYIWMERVPLLAFAFGAALRIRALRHSQFAYGGCFADPGYVEGEFGRLFVDPLRSRRVFAGQQRLLHDFDWSVVDGLAEVHARIRAPVKLIWGARDPFFPLEKLQPTLGQFGAGASLALIESGKLFAHEDFPDAFAAHAKAFLAGCWREQRQPRPAAQALE